LYDDLNQDTLLVVQDIFEYLGVEQTFEPDVASRHNVGGIPKNRALNIVMNGIRQSKTLESVAPQWALRRFRTLYNKNMGDRIEFPDYIRNRLSDLYREDILKVQDLIQRDLTFWLAP
ncbi:MAG: sulfotransferase, partial [Planctomycetes bacterium]|nr:sulfotransferase [Planctomycetota bacterium]